MDTEPQGQLRLLEPRWNRAMIAASIAISFLGAFTATQLMCQARMSLHFTTVLLWALLGSLIFGFCSIWSLHEVAMLACEFDLPIQVDATLTVISSALAVSFTFVAVSTDLLWDRYRKAKLRPRRRVRDSRGLKPRRGASGSNRQGMTPLLQFADPNLESDAESDDSDVEARETGLGLSSSAEAFEPEQEELTAFAQHSTGSTQNGSATARGRRKDLAIVNHQEAVELEVGGDFDALDDAEPRTRSSSERSFLRKSLTGDSSSASLGLSSVMDVVYNAATQRRTHSISNTFVTLAEGLFAGLTFLNISKGFLWSLAVTGMHYVGIFALQIPEGFYVFNPWLVVLSALISWFVCTVGCILMAAMETHLPQQIIFSMIAAAGVAGMHFTGMAATTFWSTAPPSEERGYPPQLASAVVGVAFITCIIANVLLAHSATVSRNKLAEIVWTRKELWKTIALKEHAEAAARARSDFIASASHEIRTPLHHLQGYSDLLAQTELTDDGRALLVAIQRATKTLSLITNNVLDWSKFEQNAESSYRPTALDIRAVCESIVVLLPNLDEDCDVQLFVVVSPDVPKTLFLDETWVHRILMNLLSNALKFTRTGYILLSIRMRGDELLAVVKDTGCGLDPAFVPDMWTPFKQGEIRGSARGTGLGLSIIKQLLGRMKGTISAESQYEQLEGIGPSKSGTTFTITIPTASTIGGSPILPSDENKGRVAIFTKPNRSRATEGLFYCWETFGFDVTMATNVSELEGIRWKYVWAELDYLIERPSVFQELQQNSQWLVLVPMDTQDSLESLPGILNAPNFVMIQRPLIWHTFEKRILASLSRGKHGGNTPARALRFATEVEVLENSLADKQRIETITRAKPVVLLVEDNPINQKLGEKMLVSLGCQVIIAFDGQDGIEQLIKHDDKIDLLLVDHSMPRKDGLVTTREIRELEASGVLSRRRPIIAVTAVVNTEAQAYFTEAGADEFLAKPLALARLRDTLSAFLPHCAPP